MVTERRVLDHGRVVLKGYSVDLEEDHQTLDLQIVRAARASYTGGTKTVREDKDLIDYLMRHGHWTPFEMVELKFFLEMPLFVVQQLLRHRTASVNQESARYSVLEEKAYLPETWRSQNQYNRQGSGEALTDDGTLSGQYLSALNASLSSYQALLQQGVARELARGVLPTATYTKLYWKIDLRNLLHFLRLRLDPHAQSEMRAYAQAIYELVRPLAPWTFEAWERHVLHAVSFSADEWAVLREMLDGRWGELETLLQQAGLSKSRLREFRQKTSHERPTCRP